MLRILRRLTDDALGVCRATLPDLAIHGVRGLGTAPQNVQPLQRLSPYLADVMVISVVADCCCDAASTSMS